MPDKLSKYKYKKLAKEALENGLRLHFDSISLYNLQSFASSTQLSIIAIEEIAKAEWIEHYYYSSLTNNGFPDRKFEQEWLNLLYNHSKKQNSFFAKNPFEFSPKFMEFVKQGKLEQLKQKATYVGLEKKRKDVNVNSRISTPKQINERNARKLISLVNDYLIQICELKQLNDYYFEIEIMDELISQNLLLQLKNWKFKSGIKSNRWFSEWHKRK